MESIFYAETKLPSITVLMSTYNGEKYLEQQLESILCQKNIELNILIRDDGSTDSTIEILEKYSKKYQFLKYYRGNNLGPAFSFLDLVKSASKTDYYALADQDDVWDDDKLITGIEWLEKLNNDDLLLYHCNSRIVDKDLGFIRNAKKIDQTPFTKYGALIENHANGCTMIFNERCRDFVAKSNPEYVSMHDSWIYLTAEMFGKVVYDETPHMSYRQHGNNVMGAKLTVMSYISKHLKRVLNLHVQPRFDNAYNFYECYKNFMSDKDRSKVEKMVNYKDSLKNKLIFATDKDFKSPSKIRNIEYIIMIMLGNI